MKATDYKNGVVHIQVNTGKYQLDVMRVDSAKGKFVVGSSFGGKIGLSTAEPRTAHSVEYLNTGNKLSKSFLKDSLTLKQFGKPLKLLWMSNGTFFGGGVEAEGSAQLVLGPVVMNRQPVSDIISTVMGKKSRWYYAQKKQTSYYGQAKNGITSTKLIQQGDWPSLIGGGAPLLINGNVANVVKKGIWVNDLGFDQKQDAGKLVGPIIASTEHITYLILAHDGFFMSWSEAASYLRDPKGFLTAIGHKKDGPIMNAVVYDGGGSPQLWVKGPGIRYHNGFLKGKPGKPRRPRPVPHRICLWGS